jgi:hypothetical protein
MIARQETSPVNGEECIIFDAYNPHTFFDTLDSFRECFPSTPVVVGCWNGYENCICFIKEN